MQTIHHLKTQEHKLSIKVLIALDTLAPKNVIRTLLTLLLYYACKVIILSWKKPLAPTLMAWKALINKALPLYEATYLSRDVQDKFKKVWGGWIDDNSTASD